MQRSVWGEARGEAGRTSAGRTKRHLASLLITSTILGSASLFVPAIAVAQQRPAAQAVSFNIPAQPLRSAINAFTRATGWEVGFTSQAVDGKRSSPVNGTLPPDQALRALLAGTGLSASISGPSTAAILDPNSVGNEGTVASDGSLVLDVIDVSGRIENAFGHVDGYVAERTGTGTKTDIPIKELPQTVDVVTADQARDQGATSIDQALRYTPGVTTGAIGPDEIGNFIWVRGWPQTNSSFYINGLQSGGYSAWDPYLFERIEVLKGPPSVLFGNSNPGGLVNLSLK